MTKIDIFSGFLGAGKTTLIKKLLKDGFDGQKVVLIENEFGKIGIDGGFLQECGIKITEMNSGCICCSLVGDFSRALRKVIDEYNPERILIEPSGVGKLSDVIRAVQSVVGENVELSSFTTVVDASKCKMYMKNFGEFYDDQISNASCIVISHTSKLSDEKVSETVKMLREKNSDATIITTDWDKLSGASIIEAMEQKQTLKSELSRLADEIHAHHHDDDDEHEHHHHHHHDDEECDDPDCECHHHHDDDDDDEHEHHHHHHHDDEECDDPDCECHHHHDDDDDDEHEHHHHHHADDVFTSWGIETTAKYSPEQILSILSELKNDEKFGLILRAKGIVEGTDGNWIHFDYVPGEPDVRSGPAAVTGLVCVIGSHIDKKAISELFAV